MLNSTILCNHAYQNINLLLDSSLSMCATHLVQLTGIVQFLMIGMQLVCADILQMAK